MLYLVMCLLWRPALVLVFVILVLSRLVTRSHNLPVDCKKKIVALLSQGEWHDVTGNHDENLKNHDEVTILK